VRLLAGRHVGGDGAALVGSGNIARLLQAPDSPEQRPTEATSQDEIGSPLISAYYRMTGDPSHLYGLANLDALSVKRQRTLPTKARVYDLLNFTSEVATHHSDEYGSRSSQAWLGSLVSNEFDLEDSCSTFDSFQDFFMDRRLDGETALELQRVGRCSARNSDGTPSLPTAMRAAGAASFCRSWASHPQVQRLVISQASSVPAPARIPWSVLQRYTAVSAVAQPGSAPASRTRPELAPTRIVEGR